MILLNTNVLSELMRGALNAGVERWFLLHEDESCLAVIALGELAFGIAKLQFVARKSKLQNQLAEWRVGFADQIHVYDAPVALAYREILASSRCEGRPMSVRDAQIAPVLS